MPDIKLVKPLESAPITLVFERHGRKDQEAEVADDRLRDLTPAGASKLFNQGHQLFQKNKYQLIDLTYSDFLRTARSEEELLRGGGYNINIVRLSDDFVVSNEVNENYEVIACKNPDIGLWKTQYNEKKLDWNYPGMPCWNKTESNLNQVAAELFREFYFPKPKIESHGDPMCMAAYATSSLNAIKNSINSLRTDGRTGLGLICSHSPVIESAANSLLGLDIDHMKRTAVPVNFPGGFRMGEYFVAYIRNPDAQNPIVEFNIKGKQASYSLLDISDISYQSHAIALEQK